MLVKTSTQYKRSSSQIAAQPQQIGFEEAFFSNRISSMWNDLPETVVNAKTVKNLKNYLIYFGRTSHLSLTFLYATSHCEPTCMGALTALSYFSAFLALSIFIQVLYRRIFSSIFIQFFFLVYHFKNFSINHLTMP